MGHALNLISLINSTVYEVRTNLKATSFDKHWKMICNKMCKLIFVSHLVYDLLKHEWGFSRVFQTNACYLARFTLYFLLVIGCIETIKFAKGGL